MSSASSYLLQHLKRQFDSSFEVAPAELVDYDEVLFIRVAEQQFALLVKDIRGLARIDRLLTIPSTADGFAGLTTVRGEVMPVFDLVLLLAPGAAPRKLAWMVRVDATECEVGLGFDEVQGYSRIPQDDAGAAPGEGLIQRTLKFRGQSTGLIHMESLLRKICTENGEPNGQ